MPNSHMSQGRALLTLLPVPLLGTLLIGWTIFEARRQRQEVESALQEQASVLARSLGPSLAAAAAAANELDELAAQKLLDNARLLDMLDRAGALDDPVLESVIETNGLDSVLFFDRSGAVRRSAGATIPLELLKEPVDALVSGEIEESILGWRPEGAGTGHFAAAMARGGGGAILVRTDAGTAYAFARRLGVWNLLDSIVESSAVLYLVLYDGESMGTVESSWDHGPPPAEPLPRGSTTILRGRRVYEVAVPLALRPGKEAELRVGLDAAPLLAATVSATRRSILVGVVLAALGIAGLAAALIHRARTQERIVAARRVSLLEEQRQQAERLAAAGALAAGIAHEVRNPLNAISLAAQRIERGRSSDSDCRQFAERIRAEVARLEEILKGFLDLARPLGGPRILTVLAPLLREVASLLEVEASARGVILSVEEGSDSASALIDRAAVRRALINLIRNAIDASPQGGRVTIAVKSVEPGVRVMVRDQGPGLDPGLKGRAFDPFVTSRAHGTGLGLALVRRVAQDHGGTAELRDLEGGGAEALLDLPAGEDPHES